MMKNKEVYVYDLPEDVRNSVIKDFSDIKDDLVCIGDMIWNKDISELSCGQVLEIQRKITNSHWLCNGAARVMKVLSKEVNHDVRHNRNSD